MMMMEERPEAVRVELVEEAQQQTQTWYEYAYSFFAEGLSSVSRALAQAEPLPQGLERLSAVGADNVEMYRVHGVVLSTGNVWQLLTLRASFPGQAFDTPYSEEEVGSILNTYPESLDWSFIQSLFDQNESDAEYRQRAQLFLRNLRNDGVAYDDDNPGDDLPTKIAKAIAQTYYETLELKVEDIQDAMTNHYGQPWNAGEFSLDNIDADFVSRIVHASIDNGRMELRTLLPYEGIVEEAVNELKHPPLTIQRVLEWMAAVWNKFVELLTDGWDYVFASSNP